MRLSDSSISNPVTQNRNKCLTGGHVRGLRITRDVVAPGVHDCSSAVCGRYDYLSDVLTDDCVYQAGL